MKLGDIHRKLIVALPEMSKESRIEFLLELLCCWLLAIGTALLQNVQLAYPLSPFSILWQTAATVAVLALFSRRWFILLITSVQLLLLGMLALIFFGITPGVLFTTLGDFFVWWFSGMPENSPLFTEEAMLAVHVLLNIGIGCLMFFVVRLSRSAVPPMALCFAILVAVMALGDTSNNSLATAAYLAGCFPLIARDHYSGRQLFSGLEKFPPLGNRWGLSIAACIVCFVAGMGILLALPGNTANLRTRWCSTVTADFQTLTNWFTNDQKEMGSPTLKQLGLQNHDTRLGGDLPILESKVLAVTDSKNPTLLRVTSYDTYTGFLWKNGFDTAYRINGYWEEEQATYLAGSALMDERLAADLANFTQQQQVTVTLKEDLTFLPATGMLTGYTEHTKTKNPVLYNRHGELMSFFGLPKGYEYTLDSVTLPVTDAPNEDIFAALHSISASGRDMLYNEEDAETLERYLALPEDYPHEAYVLAAKIVDGQSGSLQQAVALSQYFATAKGYKYTEKPGDTRMGEDVVSKLLKTKKGHSVYYATTVATMARSVGIPARLAAGYRTVWNEAEQAYVVDASKTYTWVECYIRRLGWVALDATPRRESNQMVPAPEQIEQEQEKPEQEETNTDDNDDSDDKNWKKWLPPQLWIIPLVLALLLLLRSALAHLAYRPSMARRLFPDRQRRGEFYYRDILRQLDRCDQPLRLHETLLEWLDRLDDALEPELLQTVRQALAPALAMRYGGRVLTEEEIAALSDVRTQLEKRLQKRLPLPLYVLHRHILLPVLSPSLLRRPRIAPGEERSNTHDAIG